MKKLLLSIVCLATLKGYGKGGSTLPLTGLQKQVYTIAGVTPGQQGVDALKQTEIVSGVWSCNRQLDGFLPTVVLDQYHPADRWLVRAESVGAVAMQQVRTLIQRGLPGFNQQDSDRDKTMTFDRARHSRMVVFTRKERYALTTVTVYINAQQPATATLLIESLAVHTAL
jgi:hypothetical protein